MNSFKVWTNIKNHPIAIAFMGALRAQNALWIWTDNSDEASLWCVCADKADISRVAAYYDILSKKPLVAHVSSEFKTMPYSEWTYFPTPLNIHVLHNWLRSKKLGAPETQDDSWKRNTFKLSYWPNLSMYEDGGSEFMMVCSRLLHGWCRYEQLLRYDVNREVLDTMLFDSVAEGNLIYSDESKSNEVDISDTESNNKNMFSKLFKRIVRRFA